MATAGHKRFTRLQRGRFRALVVSFPYLAFKIAHGCSQGRVSFLRPKQAYPSPLKGEGLGIVFLGLALLVHSWATLAQQGRSGASVVSFPYLAPKIAHRATQGRVWFSSSFPGALWGWQG